jgi:hypothetical protein
MQRLGSKAVLGRSTAVGKKALAVGVLTTFFGLQVVLASSSFALGLPFLTYQPPYWRTLLIYGCGAAYIGYLCWRQSPRARFAAYIFLTVDAIRAVRGSHWWTVLIDLVVIVVMQMPAFRAAYPPIRPGDLRRRRLLNAVPVHDTRSPHGREPPTNGHGRAMRA